MFPSLLPATIEPVWCPVFGMEEEGALTQEEQEFERRLELIQTQPAPTPVGVHGNKTAGMDEDPGDDDDLEDDDMEDSTGSMDDDDDDSDSDNLLGIDDDDDDDEEEEMGSDAW